MKLAVFAVAWVVTTVPGFAFGIASDFDGEKGIEADVRVGYGAFTQNSQQLISPDSTNPMGGDVLSGGANLRFSLGYRVHPLVSAGLTVQVQQLGTQPFELGGMEITSSTASSWAVGAYARFYPAALIFDTLEIRRVRFDGALDPRRFDPWVSIGVEFYQYVGIAAFPGAANSASWTRQTVGVPLSLGADVRIVPAVALGVSLSVDPWIGSGVTESMRFQVTGNPVTTTTAYDTAVGANVQWVLALGLRYTLTL